MSDLALFVAVFGGLFALRVLAATVIFMLMIPRGDRCPNCDQPTVRVKSPFADRVIPWFRKRWCLACGWQGMLRRGEVTTEPAPTNPVSARR